MFKFEGLNEFINGIESWIKEAEKEAVEVYRGMAVEAFFILAERTPQWSGNAASNWNLSVGFIDESVTTDLLLQQADKDEFAELIGGEFIDSPTKAKGDQEAVDMAAMFNAGKQYEITDLNTPVFISNSSTNLNNESYIEMLEMNPSNFLRPENDPGHMISLTVLELERDVLSESEVDKLKVLAKKL